MKLNKEALDKLKSYGVLSIVGIDSLFSHIDAVTAERDAAEHIVRNLLARIFRDGGQATARFKTLAGAADVADKLCAEYIAERDEYAAQLTAAQQRLGEMREALRSKAINIVDAYAKPFGKGKYCQVCQQAWHIAVPEKHAPNCLAAPPRTGEGG